jgi:hypothetical protein
VKRCECDHLEWNHEKGGCLFCPCLEYREREDEPLAAAAVWWGPRAEVPRKPPGAGPSA